MDEVQQLTEYQKRVRVVEQLKQYLERLMIEEPMLACAKCNNTICPLGSVDLVDPNLVRNILRYPQNDRNPGTFLYKLNHCYGAVYPLREPAQAEDVEACQLKLFDV